MNFLKDAKVGVKTGMEKNLFGEDFCEEENEEVHYIIVRVDVCRIEGIFE